MQIQLYIIGNIKWMKFNFNFPTGNYELFYDRCTSIQYYAKKKDKGSGTCLFCYFNM